MLLLETALKNLLVIRLHSSSILSKGLAMGYRSTDLSTTYYP